MACGLFSRCPWHERSIAARLSEKQIRYTTQVELPVSTADFYFPTWPRPTVVFIDGPPHLKPKRADWDMKVREVLRRFYNVVEIPYSRPTRREIARTFKEIMERLGE